MATLPASGSAKQLPVPQPADDEAGKAEKEKVRIIHFMSCVCVVSVFVMIRIEPFAGQRQAGARAVDVVAPIGEVALDAEGQRRREGQGGGEGTHMDNKHTHI